MQFGASENTFPLVPEGIFVARYLGCEGKDLNANKNNGPTPNEVAIHKFQAISPPLPPEIKSIDIISPTTLTPGNKFGVMLDKMIPGFVQFTLANQGQQWSSDMFVGCIIKIVISHVNKKNGQGKRADAKAFFVITPEEAHQFGVQHSPVQAAYLNWVGQVAGATPVAPAQPVPVVPQQAGAAPLVQGQPVPAQPPVAPAGVPVGQPVDPWAAAQPPAQPLAQPMPAAQPVPQPMPLAQPMPVAQPAPVADPNATPQWQPPQAAPVQPMAQPVPAAQPMPMAQPLPVAQPVPVQPVPPAQPGQALPPVAGQPGGPPVAGTYPNGEPVAPWPQA